MTQDFSNCVHEIDGLYFVYKILKNRYYATPTPNDVVIGLAPDLNGLRYKTKSRAIACAKKFFGDTE